MASGDSGYRVAILRKGSSRSDRRVILVPGTPSTLSGWRKTLEDARDDVEFIAIERLGFGDSDPRDAVIDFEEQLLAIEPLLADSPESVILVGHSLGGPLVIKAALRFPGRISAVVSLAGSFDPDLEEIHPLQHVGRWWGVRHLLPRMLANANEELFAHEGELRKLAEELHQVSVPVVVVHGTKDRLVPYPNAQFLLDRLPNTIPVEMRTLEGVGHVLQSHSVEAVLSAIDRALRLAEDPGAPLGENP